MFLAEDPDTGRRTFSAAIAVDIESPLVRYADFRLMSLIQRKLFDDGHRKSDGQGVALFVYPICRA